MTTHDIQLSKLLSWLLRHGAVKEGLKISVEGYISVLELLQHRKLNGKYSISDIERVVAINDKQRFKLTKCPRTNVLLIKANQGHSLDINNRDLIRITEPKYPSLVHGTYLRSWEQIKVQGLSCMKRQHIHLSKSDVKDLPIKSLPGLRKNVEVVIYIDLKKALKDNIPFFESLNGVILTPGNQNGFLETKYFEKAVLVATGEQLNF